MASNDINPPETESRRVHPRLRTSTPNADELRSELSRLGRDASVMTEDVETNEESRLAETMDAGDYADPESYRPYLAGEVIGDRYKLETQIGRGGMGVVWVAHSLVLGIDVALKLIRADAAGSGVASRMAREAHAAARLGHPALVRVFDFGWTNRGDPFLVMELVQGDTLAETIRRGSMNAIRAVQTILPIADGLRVAHERHIIHRDIKPDNIVLSADALGRRQPKLLDFGIAKIGQKTENTGKITQMGAVLGSPEYMSPEQALGLEDIDGRTDVWSLSIVLYEMLTGKIPFSRPNYNALMHAIINDDPEPTTKHGEGDGSLWRVLKKGLEKDCDARWSDMTEFGVALALWLYEHGIKEDLSGNSVRAVWLDPSMADSGQSPATYTPAPPSANFARNRAAQFRQSNGVATTTSRRNPAPAASGWAPALVQGKKSRVIIAAGLASIVALGAALTSVAEGPSGSSEAVVNTDADEARSAQAEAPRRLSESVAPASPATEPAAETGTAPDGQRATEETPTPEQPADNQAADGPTTREKDRVRPAMMDVSALPKAPEPDRKRAPPKKKKLRHDFGF